jgi:tetratricopeptide (TPR) repeat protein
MNYAENRFWMGLGATQQMLGRYEDAVEAFAFATFLDIDDPKPQLQAGYCLMQFGYYEEARSALEGVLLTDNLDPTAAIQAEALLARVEREEHDTDEY